MGSVGGELDSVGGTGLSEMMRSTCILKRNNTYPKNVFVRRMGPLIHTKEMLHVAKAFSYVMYKDKQHFITAQSFHSRASCVEDAAPQKTENRCLAVMMVYPWSGR